MVTAIVQARLASSRLPGKVLLDIAGQPMLWHVVRRVRAAGLRVVVAGPCADSALRDFCFRRDIMWYGGSETDVLSRYYNAALSCSADTVVRVTADCPLIDPFVLRQLVQLFETGKYDYVSVATGSPGGQYPGLQDRRFPDGLDAEVMSLAALRRAWVEALIPYDREHVTPYIWRNDAIFRTKSLFSPRELGELRWTVDTQDDLDFVRRVYDELGPDCRLAEIVALQVQK